MAEQLVTYYEIPDVPMTGCRTICKHANRGLTQRNTLYCPDCNCEWEWGTPDGYPHAEPGWVMTPATIRMCARTMPRFKKRSFLDWLFNPDGH
jgi:hypothetical protein